MVYAEVPLVQGCQDMTVQNKKMCDQGYVSECPCVPFFEICP